MHIAVLGNEGSWYCAEIARAAKRRNISCTRIDFPRLTAAVGVASLPLLAGSEIDLTQVDAVIVRTMPPGSLEQVVFRMDALAQLASQGVVVINSPLAIECAVDKYRTIATLHSANLPVPATIACEDYESAMTAFEVLGGDVVIKPIFGAEGRGIVRVSDVDIAHRTFRTLSRLNAVIYLQEFILHAGFDLRLLVLDGTIVGGMKRICEDDFRVNISRNGHAEIYTPTNAECQLALQAAKKTDTCFAGVDLLYDDKKNCYVIEVNAVPGWRAFARVTGIDVADKFVELIEQKIKS
ncbi:Possible glutaminyl transferase clustered with tetrahydromethanopterin biosynthesis genes [hydrothermal vent metagenome]|uniref:Possible glutaminyl transferase clustered with tetrahydromethanopterin biosynthesis genes n=1 Tax=hydrothermal vent metagenome TaxID=652676 RepID=A0A3B1DIG2_9ZZZZ